jgi:hypothetical protein
MSRFHRIRLAAACAIGLVCLPLVGCGSSGNPHKLDRAVADESLKAFLDAWKAGQTPADLKARVPPIIAGVPEFEKGTKLVDYSIGAGTEDGTNLHAEVVLTLAGNKKQQATYIVSSDPAITIFPP